MQTSKILGAAFALAIGGGAFWGMTSGLEAAQTSANQCRDTRLSMIDQNSCTSALKAATSDTAKKQVIAEYKAKADKPASSATPMTPPAPTTADPAAPMAPTSPPTATEATPSTPPPIAPE